MKIQLLALFSLIFLSNPGKSENVNKIQSVNAVKYLTLLPLTTATGTGHNPVLKQHNLQGSREFGFCISISCIVGQNLQSSRCPVFLTWAGCMGIIFSSLYAWYGCLLS